mgnify:CR=1 FL=1
MLAFAANSILTRLAISGGHIDPSGFALVRVLSGAVMLWLLVALRGGRLPLLRRNRIGGALSLALYLLGFTLAYRTLDAGLGALILFGVVQIAMFAHGALRATVPTARQLVGAGVAFAGLVVALWPDGEQGADPLGAALMMLAGLGWAAYTLLGRGATDPLASTSANFILCAPFVLLLPVVTGASFAPLGILIGVVCGAVTSGLGYALWYSVLPRMAGATAAVVQLSVPIIALIAGTLLLGEGIAPATLVATVLVVGGIGLALTARGSPAGRR